MESEDNKTTKTASTQVKEGIPESNQNASSKEQKAPMNKWLLLTSISLLAFGVVYYLFFSDPLVHHAHWYDPSYGKEANQEGKYANYTIEELRQLPERNLNLPLISLEELALYTGPKASRRYMAIQFMKSIIFDVSSKKAYSYGKSYHAFTGKDATFSLAKMNHEDEMFDRSKRHWSRDLESGEQLKRELIAMHGWLDFYKSKYPIVGYLKEDVEMLEAQGSQKTIDIEKPTTASATDNQNPII